MPNYVGMGDRIHFVTTIDEYTAQPVPPRPRLHRAVKGKARPGRETNLRKRFAANLKCWLLLPGGVGVPLTPQSILRDLILMALRSLGGSGYKAQVLDRMDVLFGHVFSEDDRRRQPSNNEVKWENQAAWERNAMVKDGLIEPYIPGRSTRGRWTLTPRGRREADRVATDFD